MGCDIHIHVERKHHVNGTEQWVNFSNWEVDPYGDCENEHGFVVNNFYKGRSYELFGALAGVRSDLVESLEPKGFPDDAGAQTKSDYERWGTDAHTPSYLTLQELSNHQEKLGPMIKRSGILDRSQREELLKGIKPSHWCQGTTSEDCERCNWEDEYNPLDGFLEDFEVFLKSKLWDHERDSLDAETIRIVFWFDN